MRVKTIAIHTEQDPKGIPVHTITTQVLKSIGILVQLNIYSLLMVEVADDLLEIAKPYVVSRLRGN